MSKQLLKEELFLFIQIQFARFQGLLKGNQGYNRNRMLPWKY